MKVLVLLFSIFILISSAFALKDRICGLPPSINGEYGRRCRAFIKSYSYHSDVDECLLFVYGGCLGNENRFDSKKSCEEKCKEYDEDNLETTATINYEEVKQKWVELLA